MVRFKNRWLLCEFIAVDTNGPGQAVQIQDAKHLSKLIRKSIELHFGDAGCAWAGSISVKYYNPATNLAIVKLPREQLHIVWSSVTLLQNLGIPRVRHVAGTIRKAQECAVVLAREALAGTLIQVDAKEFADL